MWLDEQKLEKGQKVKVRRESKEIKGDDFSHWRRRRRRRRYSSSRCCAAVVIAAAGASATAAAVPTLPYAAVPVPDNQPLLPGVVAVVRPPPPQVKPGACMCMGQEARYVVTRNVFAHA